MWSKVTKIFTFKGNFVPKYTRIIPAHHSHQTINVRSVDLVSREWCDLVFEGRNRSYGAYRLRQEAGRRYAYALLGMGLSLLLAIVLVVGVNTYFSLRSDRELAQLLEEMRRMDAQHRQDAHLLRFIDSRPREAEVQQKLVVRVPEIVDEPEVTTVVEPAVPELPAAETLVDTTATVAAPTDSLTTLPAEEPLTLPPLTPTEVVQEMPTFPGGVAALMQWLDKNIVYPPLVIHQNIEGTTFLTFLVDIDGAVLEPKVEEPLHPMISAAIMTAARRMPKWEPGRKNGQLSVVRVTIPIEYHKRTD